MTSTRCRQRVDAFASSAWRPVHGLGVAGAGRRRSQTVPVDPTRTPYELDASGRVRLSSASPLWPLPDEPMLLEARPPVMIRICRLACSWRGGRVRCGRRQLSERVHLPVAAVEVGGIAAVRLPDLQTDVGRGTKTFRSSASSCSAGAAGPAARRLALQYPIVEAVDGDHVRVGLAGSMGRRVLLVSRLIFGCALIVLFAIDLEHHLLPNAITLPGIVAGIHLQLLMTEPGWVSSLIGILVGGGLLYAIAEAYYRVRHEEGLGMGDVKMLAMVGAFIGWQLTLLTLDAGVVRRLGDRRQRSSSPSAAA